MTFGPCPIILLVRQFIIIGYKPNGSSINCLTDPNDSLTDVKWHYQSHPYLYQKLLQNTLRRKTSPFSLTWSTHFHGWIRTAKKI